MSNTSASSRPSTSPGAFARRPGFPALASLAVATAFAAVACTGAGANEGGAGPGGQSTIKGVAHDAAFPRDTLQCGPGEGSFLAYSFAPTSLSPDRAEIGLEGEFVTRPPQKTRIDLCLNEDTLEVFPKRMVTWSNEGGAGAWSARARVLARVVERADATFAEAIPENDFSRLETRFVADDAEETSYLLKGWKTAKGEAFVTLSPYVEKKGGPLTVTLGTYLAKRGWTPFAEVGVVGEGDPFVPKKDCQARAIALAGVSLSYEFCKWGSHGTLISYEFKKVDVTDASDAGAAPVVFAAAGPAAEAAIDVNLSHHSFSDGFSITAGDRIYRLNPRDDLPPRSDTPERFELTVEKGRRIERIGVLPCQFVYECGERVEK